MQHAQLVQGTGGRHIKKPGISVVGRICRPCGIQEQNRIEFQSLGKFHREHHDAASEHRLFQIALRHGNQLLQLFRRPGSFLSVPADHGDGIEALFLPVPADPGAGFEHTAPAVRLSDLHRIPMTDDGLRRVGSEASMFQNPGGKFRDFHRVAVAFFQNSEIIPVAGKQQAL